MPQNVTRWTPDPPSVEKSLELIADQLEIGPVPGENPTVVDLLDSIAQSLHRIANVMDPDGAGQ